MVLGMMLQVLHCMHACFCFSAKFCSDKVSCCAGWLFALLRVSDDQDSQNEQDGCLSHDFVARQHSTPCRAASVSGDDTMHADAHQSYRPGCVAVPPPSVQHMCLHHMQLPCENQAAPSQQTLTSCSAYMQPWHRPSQPNSSPSSSANAPSSTSAPARAATALASRAIKQKAASPVFPSSSCTLAVLHSQCHVCSAESRAADAVHAVMAASPSQQECCCDCGYVTKSPSRGTFRLGFTRPALGGGRRAATAAACRPLSADVSKAATPAACRRLSADVKVSGTAAAYRPLSAGASRSAIPAACRPDEAADVSKAGKPTLQNTSAVGPGGAVGDLLSHSLHTAAALKPVIKEQREYMSPLSHLRQSFSAELGLPSSLAVRMDGPSLEAGQGQHQKPTMAGSHCCLHCPAQNGHSEAADHQAAWSNDRDQQLEVSPETSFLQRLDQCRQTRSESPKAQLDQQQQTKALSATMTDLPDFAKYTGCRSLQPVDAQQQEVGARTLGMFIAQPEATAGGTSAVSASTAAAMKSPEADSSSSAAIVRQDCQDRTAAGHSELRQDEACELGAIIADTSQLMQARLFAESANQLCGNGMSSNLSSAPPASAVPAASKTVTVTASAAMQSLAEHVIAFPESSTAADTSAVHATSLPAVLVPNDSLRRCAARRLETGVDNAQQPALQPPHVTEAQSSNGRSQGLSASLAEPDAMQQQQPQHRCSAHAGIEHRDASIEVVDVGVETEHRWLLSAAWAEQRQWLAARRCSGAGDAMWELDESGSTSGDSEGSVSSESTLRPSSVGRCRVNSGRHAKVGSTLVCQGLSTDHTDPPKPYLETCCARVDVHNRLRNGGRFMNLSLQGHSQHVCM